MLVSETLSAHKKKAKNVINVKNFFLGGGLVILVQAAIICCYKIYDSTLKTSRSSNSRRVLCSETFELQTPM